MWTGSRVLVWGGSQSDQPLSDAFLYDPATDFWTAGDGEDQPTAADDVAWAWSGTDFYVFGGSPGGSGETSDFHAFRPSTQSWSVLPTGPSARYGAFGVWNGTSVFVWGGRNSGGAVRFQG